MPLFLQQHGFLQLQKGQFVLAITGVYTFISSSSQCLKLSVSHSFLSHTLLSLSLSTRKSLYLSFSTFFPPPPLTSAQQLPHSYPPHLEFLGQYLFLFLFLFLSFSLTLSMFLLFYFFFVYYFFNVQVAINVVATTHHRQDCQHNCHCLPPFRNVRQVVFLMCVCVRERDMYVIL